MRAARRAGRDRARQRLQRSRRGGRARARRALREICARTGIRIVGPSSLGVVDLRHKTFLTANAAFDEPDLPVGRIFAASHSRRHDRHVPVARQGARHRLRRPRLGRQRGRSVDRRDLRGDARRSRHRRLRAVPRNHAQGARRCAPSRCEAAERGKPILAYKLGRSAAARELAVSHTGALAGEDDIADMFLAECGIARVDTLEGLIEGFPLLARVPARARGARRADRRGGHHHRRRRHHGGRSAGPQRHRGRAAERRRRSRASRPRPASRSRRRGIIDLTLAGAQYDVMKAALDVLTTAPEFDLVVAAIGSSARFYPDLAVKPIIDSAGAAQADRGVPGAGGARRAGAACRPPACRISIRRRPAPTRSPPRCGGRAPRPIEVRPRASAGTGTGTDSMLDELEAYALLDRLGVPRAPSVALDASIDEGARPALCLSGRGQGAVRRDRAQVRRRRRRAERQRRRSAARRDRRKSSSATKARPRAGAADDRGPRRGADRLSRRPRRRPAGDAGGRRHPRRNPPRPQPAARAGRSRRGARP